MIGRAALLRRLFVGASMAWATALPLAAFAVSRPAAGEPSYLFALAVYLVGGAVCHQLDERSFHLWGRQMPVCARCTGIYLGAAIAGLAAAIHRRRSGEAPGPSAAAGVPAPSRRARSRLRLQPRAVLALAALPAAASLVFEWTTGTMPGNMIRAATGLALGAAVASVVVYEVN